MPFRAALAAALPPHRIVDDPDVIAAYSNDQAAWAPAGKAALLVRPADAEEVRRVVELCFVHRVPVVARGAGTGLSGGANAVDECVVLSLEGMNRVLEIDTAEQLAVVQPGVVNDDLRAAVAEHGLWYPPDPASSPWSTLGGNAATNAGGVCCLKYGVTRDYVLGLQVVTGEGKLVRLGRRTRKGVAGYDLTALMIGSEGTLGVITELTVRLLPLPRKPHTIVGAFGSLVAAGEAVAEVARRGLTPDALELVDRYCLQAVDEWKNMGLADLGDVLLLARSSTEEAAIQDAFDAAGAVFSTYSTDEEEAEALFAARRLAYPALERLGPVLTEDVCVPRALVPEMLARIERHGQAHGVHVANIAHAGDGNLHPLIIAEDPAKAQIVFDLIIDDCLDLGGTVTGEHGVGLLKMRGMHTELGQDVLAMHRAVKAALDPAGILNPGKVI
ncbi:FAD-binding oxidoreductase [Nonomuraea soli]|uniref:Glycolate oxidase n=1 Tax=Nonomuraea soli TaxID=1032476 RepID=A0A7W0HTN2_9ACTN|nr:FAD-linked oxidase C-terminal domain-containing protein [Nonomuraea soli]MBA2895328.1 glycolate oxidase [Nonomuraea soli]